MVVFFLLVLECVFDLFDVVDFDGYDVVVGEEVWWCVCGVDVVWCFG